MTGPAQAPLSEPLMGWRKIAGAAWGPPNDPQIYGLFAIDATRLVALIREAREHGEHVTPTHLVGRALARALALVPSLNVRLVGGRAVARDSVDVFFITAVGRRDLSGVKIEHADRKSAVEVARELSTESNRVKSGTDPGFARTKELMERLPLPVLRLALRATSWLAGTRGVPLPPLGVAKSPFGSAMVSSVGMLGVPTAFTPLASIYKVPAILLVGTIEERPVAVDGRVEVRPILPVTATIDHRYADGAELAVALRAFREYLENPATHEPAFAAATAPAS